GELAGRVSTAADQLGTMISSHRAAAAMDIVKQGLETYLATHVGGSVSLGDLGPGFVEALEGVICRAEMARFRDELRGLAGDLRSADPSSMSHEEISSLYMRIRDFRARVPALAEFGRQSFPGVTGTDTEDISHHIFLFTVQLTRFLHKATVLQICFFSGLLLW
ncbi:MAG: hypothetical protein R6V56_05715, partial [Lentisphaeria bacterium]